MEVTQANIFSVPKELLAIAFSHLNEKELAVASCVSKEFEKIANEYSLWVEIGKKWGVTVDSEDPKGSFINQLIEMNNIVREIFPKIPKCETISKQNQANRDYLAGRIEREPSEFERQGYFFEVMAALYQQIEAGNLKNVKALFFNGLKTNVYDLGYAIQCGQKEMVKFFLDNCGQEYEKQITEEEQALKKRGFLAETTKMERVKHEKETLRTADEMIYTPGSSSES